MTKRCRICGSEFSTEDKRRKYCGVGCYRIKAKSMPNGGAFKAGNRPWNANLKGIHLSPGTEFRVGQERDLLPLGTVRIRCRPGRGDAPRAYVKIAHPNGWKLRAHVAWECAHGPIPAGMVIHHMDHDSLNDHPSNLRALTRAEHAREHQQDLGSYRAGQLSMFGGG